jgi:hypothetical protein
VFVAGVGDTDVSSFEARERLYAKFGDEACFERRGRIVRGLVLGAGPAVRQICYKRKIEVHQVKMGIKRGETEGEGSTVLLVTVSDCVVVSVFTLVGTT